MDGTQNAPVILSAARTPIGKFQGSLAGVPAAELGAAAVRAALERAGLLDLTRVNEAIIGNVVSAGLGQNIARQVALRGGLPESVGALAVNKVCGSSLKAVMLAAQAIRAGEGDLFVAGGVESMSRAPYLVDARTTNFRFGNLEMRDSLLSDGLWCAFESWPMGNAAELIAEKYAISREAMDCYALESHQKAVAAMEQGKFDAEIVPVVSPGRKGEQILVDRDEVPRRDTSLEALCRLPPAFQPGGKVTAGNSPGLNDAAAALVVASPDAARSLGSKPLARIVGQAQAAVAPRYIFDAPALAIPRLLEKIGWTLETVDLLEVNEAFAAQILANGQVLAGQGWEWSKINVHGGAIALGHPLGATGARILTTLVYALADRGLRRGIASLCLGGGEAVALAVEMVNPGIFLNRFPR
ncbi:MAG TPA: thiolase family protein [Anaerolineaceae bacterium]|nr:thiolase family protein [Anaerolineaceae bacterium]